MTNTIEKVPQSKIEKLAQHFASLNPCSSFDEIMEMVKQELSRAPHVPDSADD